MIEMTEIPNMLCYIITVIANYGCAHREALNSCNLCQYILLLYIDKDLIVVESDKSIIIL